MGADKSCLVCEIDKGRCMRFILNFFIFGFIFFLISVYFPEAFKTLVGWAEAAFTFVVDGLSSLFSKGSTPPAK